MKTALLVCAALVPALVSADDSKPYVVSNGRGPSAAAADANQPLVVTGQASAFGSSAVRPNVSTPVSAKRIASAAPGRAEKSPRRVTGSSGADQSRPPNFDKPGALIRSEGQLPRYADPGNARAHSVEGGGLVDIDQKKARDVGRAPGIAWSAPDTPPSVNPTSRAGGTAVTANGPATPANGGASNVPTTGGASGGDSGGGKSGGGGVRDDSAPVGTGFDGSF